MNVGHANDGGFSERSAGLRLTPAVSPRGFSTERLEQLWRLQGGHPRDFLDVCVQDDVRSKKHLQTYAIADMPTAEYEWTGEGPKTANAVVGWMRARYERAFKGDVPFADIEGAYIDRRVDQLAVHAFLLRRMQERIRKGAYRIAGLRVEVPGELTRYAAYYMEHGFRDDGAGDTMVWIPPSD